MTERPDLTAFHDTLRRAAERAERRRAEQRPDPDAIAMADAVAALAEEILRQG